MLFHKFRHIKANHGTLTAEKELGQRSRNFGFADARRSQEQERADGTVRILQARPRAPNGTRQRRDCWSLRYYALMQLILDAQQFLGVPFLKRSYRHAGPPPDHYFDIG